MTTIARLIDKARLKSGSNYSQIGERLKRSRQTISNWRSGERVPEDDEVIALAHMAGEDADGWLAVAQAARTDGAAKRHWEAIAKRLGVAATVLLVLGGLTALPEPTQALAFVFAMPNVHYAKFNIPIRRCESTHHLSPPYGCPMVTDSPVPIDAPLPSPGRRTIQGGTSMKDGSSVPDVIVRRISLIGGLGVAPMVRLSLSARRLLSLLALRGQPMARKVVSAQLWPDCADEVGRTNLRRTLWQVPHGWVSTFGEDLILEADSDVPHAHEAAACALRGEMLGFDQIELLCSGILPGWTEEWVLPAQDAFHLLRVQALEVACRTLTAHGQHALAVRAGAAAVAAEPLSESASEALIEAHLAQHNRFMAMQCFRSLVDRLEEELGVGPDPVLEQRVHGMHTTTRLRPP